MTSLATFAKPEDRSWVFGANDDALGLPLQHLPYCAFQEEESGEPRLGVVIGSCVLDMNHCSRIGLFRDLPEIAAACFQGEWNGLMALGPEAWSLLRAELQTLLRIGATVSAERRQLAESALLPSRNVRFVRPAIIPNYTDFYASIQHATRVGRLFRPTSPLLPNYKYIPIGYHGRASSILLDGTRLHRPCGQARPLREGEQPVYGLTTALDYELELGFYVGVGNELGTTIPVEEAGERLFGVSLLNDWSARDIQAWEYQPLGPFLGKSFATTVSSWITPMAALEPFRCKAAERAAGDPSPLAYLWSEQDQRSGNLHIVLEVLLQSAQMKKKGIAPVLVCRSNSSELYWTAAQMVTHHTSNGCNLQSGDLLGSGTISGDAADALGCLLELTRNGAERLALPSGETRAFLEDGDEVILRGFCECDGHPRLALGTCRGTVLAAV